MKRIRIAILALILAAAFGCAKEPVEPDPTPTAQIAAAEQTPQPAEQPAPAMRTLLVGNGVTLTGSLDMLSDGWRGLQLCGASGASDASGASMSFSLNRESGGGRRQMAGMLYFGRDASALFDLEEQPEGEAANTMLSELCENRLREAGASVAAEESNGISWKYGFAETAANGVASLELLAWAATERGVLYVTASASDNGGAALDDAKDALKAWLKTLTLSERSGETGTVAAPRGERMLTAADWDALSFEAAALSWNATDGFFNGTYGGRDGETSFYAVLQNAPVAGEDAIAAAQAAAAETLESPLGWRYAVTEDTLTAVAALNGETLLFELTLAPAADGAVDSGILTRALDWLKTVTIG